MWTSVRWWWAPQTARFCRFRHIDSVGLYNGIKYSSFTLVPLVGMNDLIFYILVENLFSNVIHCEEIDFFEACRTPYGTNNTPLQCRHRRQDCRSSPVRYCHGPSESQSTFPFQCPAPQPAINITHHNQFLTVGLYA